MVSSNQINKILQYFKLKLKSVYGEKLKNVVLYGSYARGEATQDSDIDVAVILEGPIQPGLEVDRMIDIITEINLEYDVLLSVYPVAQKDYLSINSPLLINLRQEGIAA